MILLYKHHFFFVTFSKKSFNVKTNLLKYKLLNLPIEFENFNSKLLKLFLILYFFFFKLIRQEEVTIT